MNFKIERKGYSKTEVEQYINQLKADYESQLASQREAISVLKESSQKLSLKVDEEAKRYDLISKSIISANEKAEEIERLTADKYSSEVENLRLFHDKWKGYFNKIMASYPLDEQLQGVEKFNISLAQILNGDGENALTDSEVVDDVMSLLEQAHVQECSRINEKRIGYITVKTDVEMDAADEMDKSEMGSENDAFSEDFDPISRIKQFLSLEKRAPKSEKKKDKKPAVKKQDKVAAIEQEPIEESSNTASDDYFSNGDYADRAPSGYSFEEAMNPTDDLEDIMRDLGLLMDEN